MFRTSPHPKPRRSPRTAAALTAGTALAAVILLAGPAAAAPGQEASTAPAATAGHASSADGHGLVTRLICTESAGGIGRLPAESVPVRVCKLVNGWD
ncbi:hypothetical protein [Streptomyces sp. NPDC057554]|uniref:hypothetical protein n=1 Tax=Streptomyces sp. NPDC057554 TaxID=3350538 RepID=UPI003699354C